MAGREVFKAAVLSMADACDQALQQAGLTGADIDLLIPHQANIRIIEATAKHAGLPMDKVYVNVRSEEHTSELQSHSDLVCRLLLEKKKKKKKHKKPKQTRES